MWRKSDNVFLLCTVFVGVYGMWNIYTAALMFLYAPSFKTSAEPGENTQLLCFQRDYFGIKKVEESASTRSSGSRNRI